MYKRQAEYQATLDELEADEARIRRQAQQLQKQLEEQMKAQGKNYNTNPGGYIWPVDSRYITSTVVGRNSPGGVGSTNHKGTDIGRVGYTSPVYAAKAGTVIVARRSSSYGNYVVISHEMCIRDRFLSGPQSSAQGAWPANPCGRRPDIMSEDVYKRQFQHIGPVADGQRHFGVLLHQQDGDAALMQLLDHGKNFLDKQRA